MSSLANLRVADESRITWEQVSELRRDEEAKRKYRRLVHWLDSAMVGKPLSFVQDEIALRLEQYEWALKKHGFAR